jgi:hypothetical protein
MMRFPKDGASAGTIPEDIPTSRRHPVPFCGIIFRLGDKLPHGISRDNTPLRVSSHPYDAFGDSSAALITSNGQERCRHNVSAIETFGEPMAVSTYSHSSLIKAISNFYRRKSNQLSRSMAFSRKPFIAAFRQCVACIACRLTRFMCGILSSAVSRPIV